MSKFPNSYDWYQLDKDSLPSAELDDRYFFEIFSNWKEYRINIYDKQTNELAHTSAIFKFSFFLIQTTLTFGPIIGDSKTKLNARGNNLYGFALKFLVRWHFSKNTRLINALVVPGNEIPTQKLPKIGFVKLKRLYFLKIPHTPVYIRCIF